MSLEGSRGNTREGTPGISGGDPRSSITIWAGLAQIIMGHSGAPRRNAREHQRRNALGTPAVINCSGAEVWWSSWLCQDDHRHRGPRWLAKPTGIPWPSVILRGLIRPSEIRGVLDDDHSFQNWHFYFILAKTSEKLILINKNTIQVKLSLNFDR